MGNTPLTGRYCSVRTSDDNIDSMGHWEITIATDSQEVGEFGSYWKKNLPMMMGWTGRVEGFIDVSTSSQDQLMTLAGNMLDAAKLQDFRFYLQSSSGQFWMPAFSTSMATQSTDAGAYITNMSISADFNNLARVSYDIVGYGPIALFEANSSAIVLESTA